jgi:hypothetical protein
MDPSKADRGLQGILLEVLLGLDSLNQLWYKCIQNNSIFSGASSCRLYEHLIFALRRQSQAYDQSVKVQLILLESRIYIF